MSAVSPGLLCLLFSLGGYGRHSRTAPHKEENEDKKASQPNSEWSNSIELEWIDLWLSENEIKINHEFNWNCGMEGPSAQGAAQQINQSTHFSKRKRSESWFELIAERWLVLLLFFIHWGSQLVSFIKRRQAIPSTLPFNHWNWLNERKNCGMNEEISWGAAPSLHEVCWLWAPPLCAAELHSKKFNHFFSFRHLCLLLLLKRRRKLFELNELIWSSLVSEGVRLMSWVD